MHDQGTFCLRSGGGKMVVVLVRRAARLRNSIDIVTQE